MKLLVFSRVVAIAMYSYVLPEVYFLRVLVESKEGKGNKKTQTVSQRGASGARARGRPFSVIQLSKMRPMQT